MNQRLWKMITRTAVGTLFALQLITTAKWWSKPPQGSGLSKDDVDKMIHSLSNWGRWGKEDQLGALNLITPQKRKQAAALVKEGVSVSLARDVIKEKAFDSSPFVHKMLKTGQPPETLSSGDEYSVAYHGFTQTHLDALCHLFYKGQMYNGFSQTEVADKGALKLSVINMKNGIITRGVLLDFPRLWGVKYLKGRQTIYPKDLDEWERRTNVKIETGDAVLISTGRWKRYEKEGEWDAMRDSAGLDVTCMPWLKKRDVAVLGSDLATDVSPSGIRDVLMPVHLISIVAMGVPILDNCDLETLGETAASRNRWTFLLTVDPLAVNGGTGSPVNPVATF